MSLNTGTIAARSRMATELSYDGPDHDPNQKVDCQGWAGRQAMNECTIRHSKDGSSDGASVRRPHEVQENLDPIQRLTTSTQYQLQIRSHNVNTHGAGPAGCRHYRLTGRRCRSNTGMGGWSDAGRRQRRPD